MEQDVCKAQNRFLPFECSVPWVGGDHFQKGSRSVLNKKNSTQTLRFKVRTSVRKGQNDLTPTSTGKKGKSPKKSPRNKGSRVKPRI